MNDPAELARLVSDDDALRTSLYAKHQKVYPREVHGLFASLRIAAVLALLGLFYGVCWLGWDGKQLVLFDLPARQFHLFGRTYFPQDFVLLTLLLIAAALALFLLTALAGRVWCGYACPQTVYTEVFLYIERLIEGDRPRRRKLDREPWTARKLYLKAGKHLAWGAISLWTGFTFVAYFTPASALMNAALGWSLSPWEIFWVLFYGFATYGNAGWMREQVCIYMCPYARFQGAMFDQDTLIISYDPGRGEPRGSRRRSTDHRARGLGDCIDCTLCVQVCPTGIDIRDGLQYQCVACASCIDVCNDVMAKMGYPSGLIRYTSENALTRGARAIGRVGATALRTRILIYVVLLAALVVGFGYLVTARVPLMLDVLRDRNALYRETSDGRVENVYQLKIINMDGKAHRYAISVRGLDGADLELDARDIEVAARAVGSVPARVAISPARLDAVSSRIEFVARSLDAPKVRAVREARFLGWTTR